MSFASVRRRVPGLSWVQKSLLAGALIGVAWTSWETRGLPPRIVRDTLLFIVAPLVLGSYYGRDMGWRVDRLAIRNAILLSLFVAPFYIIGSSLPTIRNFYPMWSTTTALGQFLPHAFMQFIVALAAESYYRGLLCVGVRDIGRKAIFISPIVYAFHHIHKPPIELALSGPTDVLFGFVDYESNSLLPSVIAHGMGLALLDWLVLHEPLIPAETVLGWLRWLPLPL